MNPHLSFLLSTLYARSALHPDHVADLRKSGLSDETIAQQKITSIPPSMIDQLLGFAVREIVSAYLMPFADPRGGWMDHVRLKVFPTFRTERGTIKYLQPRKSGVRIYFPMATLDAAVHPANPLWLVEGEKKSLAVAQLGLPTIGICGVEGWHVGGTRSLHPDLDIVPLGGRTVEMLPDGDVSTNSRVARSVRQLADALRAVGARPRLVHLPQRIPA